MQAQNKNSDKHMIFPGWSLCFGESQASDYPDQVSDQRDNVGAKLHLPWSQCAGIKGKILVVCTRFSLKRGVRAEAWLFYNHAGKALDVSTWKAQCGGRYDEL